MEQSWADYGEVALSHLREEHGELQGGRGMYAQRQGRELQEEAGRLGHSWGLRPSHDISTGDWTLHSNTQG